MNNARESVLPLKIKIILFYFFAFLFLFLAARFALLFSASAYFSTLSVREVLLSFSHGIRFDLYAISLFVFPFFILFLFPVKNKLYLKIFAALFPFIALILGLFLTADIVFFHTFGNHIGIELLSSFTHAGLFAQLALQTYWYLTYPILAVFIAVLISSFRFINHNFPTTLLNGLKFVLKSSGLILLCGLFMFFCIRGRLSLHRKPLSLIETQALGNARSADLIVNGVFYAYETIRKAERRNTYFNEADILSTAKALLSPDEQTDEKNPFERIRTKFSLNGEYYNFVIILFESWDWEIIKKFPQAAPNFMKIKEKSLFFPNFFSSGTRSLIGTTATLFSVPHIWGLPNITNGLGAKNMSRVGLIFKSGGYATANIITDVARADHADKSADYLGFDTFYSKEDIPIKNKYPVFNKGFDYDGFKFLFDKINGFSKKFFVCFYTSSTHVPYDILLSREYQNFPQDTQEHQYLNRLYYADAGLGRFFEMAEKQPWFDNTVFLFMPDHRAHFTNKKPEANLTETQRLFSSFLLVYAPKLIKAGVSEIYGNQEDVLPTLIDMANISESYSSSGQSLFDKNRNPVKFIYRETRKIYIVGPDINEELDASRDIKIADLSPLQKQALAFNEAIYSALKNNSWKKK
jgi:phosphoglycerol transferase MdoB-like AlkP superfamily enzyme